MYSVSFINLKKRSSYRRNTYKKYRPQLKKGEILCVNLNGLLTKRWRTGKGNWVGWEAWDGRISGAILEYRDLTCIKWFENLNRGFYVEEKSNWIKWRNISCLWDEEFTMIDTKSNNWRIFSISPHAAFSITDSLFTVNFALVKYKNKYLTLTCKRVPQNK
jgi:hypothetical protein